MKDLLLKISETLKTLKVDPAFDNVDKWVGCIGMLQRIAAEIEEGKHDVSCD